MSDCKDRDARSIAEIMQHEHEQIDRGLELLITPRPYAHRDNHQVLSILQNHMALEEGWIFPVFEKAGYAAPVELMLLEHEKIRQHLREITSLLVAGDMTAIKNETRLLAIRLGEHNGKEEAIFYDRLEASMDEETRRHLLHYLLEKGQ